LIDYDFERLDFMVFMVFIITNTTNDTVLNAFRLKTDDIEHLAQMIASLSTFRVLEMLSLGRFFHAKIYK
jgi:hypothetical protein